MKKLVFIILILLIGTGCDNDMNTRSFSFTYTVDLKSTAGKKLELWVPVPKSNEVQQITRLRIDTDGLKYKLNKEVDHGNKYIYVYDNDGTYSTKTVSITCNVKRKEHSNESYVNVDPNKYLTPYFTVPVGGVFNYIIRENNLSKSNIRGIYDYVLSGMHYGKPKSINDKYYKEPWLNEDGKYGLKDVSRDYIVKLYQRATIVNGNYTFGNGNSIYACDIGVGNCTDYHSYFMSLGRTMDIPVRFHMGFPIPSKEEGEIDGYHCWADYFVDGEGWHPVDISEADIAPDRSDYFFGTVCNNRVEMMIGRDFLLEGYEPIIANFFIYPLLEVADKSSTAFKKQFSYKNI